VLWPTGEINLRHRQQVMRSDTAIATIFCECSPASRLSIELFLGRLDHTCDSRLQLIIGAAGMQFLRFESLT
jgi:hypothetical protein